MSRGNMQWSLLNSWQESFQDLVTGMLGMSLTAITTGFPYLIQADWTISEQSIRVPAMPRGSSACFVVYQQFLYAPGWLLTPLLFSRVQLGARSLGPKKMSLPSLKSWNFCWPGKETQLRAQDATLGKSWRRSPGKERRQHPETSGNLCNLGKNVLFLKTGMDLGLVTCTYILILSFQNYDQM